MTQGADDQTASLQNPRQFGPKFDPSSGKILKIFVPAAVKVLPLSDPM